MVTLDAVDRGVRGVGLGGVVGGIEPLVGPVAFAVGAGPVAVVNGEALVLAVGGDRREAGNGLHDVVEEGRVAPGVALADEPDMA